MPPLPAPGDARADTPPPNVAPRIVVLTGGPGAGKTAVLEIVRHAAAVDVVVLPESASVVFGGGFPRRPSRGARAAAQRAIYFVQRELETVALDDDGPARVILCDRGTVDGLAYWPDEPDEFFRAVGSDQARELAHYAAVIHLQVPTVQNGYRSIGLRVETREEAAAIDRRIELAWSRHPRRFFVASTTNFIAKAARVMQLVSDEIALAQDARGADPRIDCVPIPQPR